MLLRRYDRESKANKRLSMDNEELSFRLTVGETGGSPDIMRRSISHSPTNEAVGHAVMRKRSPLPPPLSPRSPKSPATTRDFNQAFSNSGSALPANGNGNVEDSLTPTNSGLKRSGTYELLHEQFKKDGSSEGNHSRHSNNT